MDCRPRCNAVAADWRVARRPPSTLLEFAQDTLGRTWLHNHSLKGSTGNGDTEVASEEKP